MANDGSVTDLALPEVDDIAAVAAEAVANSGAAGPKEMKFEQTRVASATSTKITTGDGYSSEEATANASHSRRVQADGLHYEESGQAAAMKARLEMDGVTAEKSAAVKQVRPLFIADCHLCRFCRPFGRQIAFSLMSTDTSCRPTLCDLCQFPRPKYPAHLGGCRQGKHVAKPVESS